MNNTGIVDDNMVDKNGHTILVGDWFAEVTYLQKKSQSAKYVKYERSLREQHVFIHIGEIFTTNILIDANLKMSIEEYNAVLMTAL